MKIVLISPHLEIWDCGIRIISACLKKKGHDVKLIFLPRDFMLRYKKKILDSIVNLSKDSDLIGISVMTNLFSNAVQITQRFKKSLDVPIIWGGVHPTIRPKECLDYADIVCIGEGEEAIVELTDRMQSDKPYYDVDGLWFKTKEIISNRIRPLIQDLDSFPFQDYDYSSHYILDDNEIHKMDKSLFLKYTYSKYMTMPTRGCPYGCSYCYNNTLNEMYYGQKIIRKRSPNNIVNELIQAKEKMPFINHITFDDDAFFLYTREELKELCMKYKENVNLSFSVSGASPITINRDKLSLLVNAGLSKIRMGIQTASEQTMKLYKRRYTALQVKNAVKIINKFSKKLEVPQYDIIIDNPWESDKDLIKTLMFLSELEIPYELSIFSLTFYPGTELYRLAKKDGIIKNDRRDIYDKHYHKCGKKYLNKLFFLLNEYTSGGGKISPATMRLLTSDKIKELKLNWLFYFLLKIGAIPFKIRHILSLVNDGLRDIRRGNWCRIKRYILKYF